MTVKPVLLAALCISLSGCGAALTRGAGPADMSAGAVANPYMAGSGAADKGPAHQRGKGLHQRGGFGPFGGRMAKELGLSADQTAAIKAVMAKYHPQPATKPDPGARKAKREAFKKLLTSDPLDTAGVKAALEKRRDEAAKRQQKQVDMLGELRDLLTADQREKLASGIESHKPGAKGQPPQGGKGQGGKFARRGGPAAWGHGPQGTREGQAGDRGKPPAHAKAAPLTDEQKAALKAILAKRRGDHKPGDRQAALAAFWRNGDKAALLASLASPDLTDDVVAFLGTLAPDQRAHAGARLLGRGGWRHGFRGGHPGGPGK